MATQGFQDPTLAPDLLRKQYQLQNSQAIAQGLMQQGQQPQGQMVGNQYVAPSWTQQLAAALRPVIGQQVANRLPEQQADLQRAQRAHDMERFSALYGGGQGQGSAPSSQQDLQREFMAAQLMGMDKYAAERMKWQAPTSEQKNLGFLPQSQRDQLIAAPFINEMSQDGVQNVLGPGGQVQAFEVPGYRDIQARTAGDVAGAQEGARAAMDLVEVPDGQGGTVTMPRSQAVQALGRQPQGGRDTQEGGLGTSLPETVLEARADLPKVTQQATQMIDSIDGILNHPGLSSSVGVASYLPVIRGTDRADFVTRSEQLQGQAFLQAFESLKGGGQITEIEGTKAEQAMARLNTAQSEKEYRASLNDLKEVLTSARKRAYDNARIPVPGVSRESGDGQIPTITSQEQLQSLSPGSLFIAPDGTTRRVP